jgi:hypothetical protein
MANEINANMTASLLRPVAVTISFTVCRGFKASCFTTASVGFSMGWPPSHRVLPTIE